MAEHTHLQRTLRILQRLSIRKRVTVNELYAMLDGSETKRTIQRTLEDIQNSNIPLPS